MPGPAKLPRNGKADPVKSAGAGDEDTPGGWWTSEAPWEGSIAALLDSSVEGPTGDTGCSIFGL